MKEGIQRRSDACIVSRGSKPRVAYETQAKAEENLKNKLRRLLEALGAPVATEVERLSLLSGLPTSVRQFNHWKLIDQDGSSLRANSNATLKRHSELYISVKSSVSAIRKHQQEITLKRGDREERLVSARRRQKIDRTLREIAERELVRARRELTNMRSELVQLKNQLASLKIEAQSEIGGMNEKMCTLAAENSQLKLTLKKIVPLKRL